VLTSQKVLFQVSGRHPGKGNFPQKPSRLANEIVSYNTKKYRDQVKKI
jgi:hypothetical protein